MKFCCLDLFLGHGLYCHSGANKFLIGVFVISFNSLGLDVHKTAFSCDYRVTKGAPDLKRTTVLMW